MKFVIINDTHFGARNSSTIFIEYQRRFYSEIMFPYMRKHDIKHIVHLGDMFEHRKYINFVALNSCRKHFLQVLKDEGITMDIIPGNHDVVYKSTNELCSLKELLGYYTNNVNIIMEPRVMDYDGCQIALIPWINNQNYADTMNFVKNCKASIVGGHFEFSGIEMHKGVKSTHGMGMSEFKRFEQVWSGHYHTRSFTDNIHYFGSQMEFTWADVNDPKFFHVFDTETREVTPVRNPITMFEKVIYNDEEREYDTYDVEKLAGKFVKVVVAKKTNPFDFDRFIDRIQDVDTHELKIAETFNEFMGENVDDNEISVEDTTTLLDSYVEAIETDLDKERVKGLMRELYTEAANLEIA